MKNIEVVVTGMGLITPLECGAGTEEFWRLLIEGRGAVNRVSLFDASPYSSDLAAEIRGVVIKPGRSRWASFLETALGGAIKDSGLRLDEIDSSRVGMVLGTVLGTIFDKEAAWRSGSAAGVSQGGLHLEAVNLAGLYGIHGPITTVSTACSSGTDAIGLAYRAIKAGHVDVVFAGGGDTLSEMAYSGFSSLHALTDTVVRPFDATRNGLAPSEGAAFLVLEERGRVEERGARIYGVIRGYASSADAVHMTAPDREGRGLTRAIRAALKEASKESVDYISAHGTGTPYNDLMETKAIKKVFGKGAYGLPVNSLKAALGHSFGAAGAIEAAACLMTMSTGSIAPTLNLESMDPECDLDYVPDIGRQACVKSTLSISAGFGGQNAAILFTSPGS